MSAVTVKWGQSVDGYGWGRAGYTGDRLHLVSWDNDPFDYEAVCGKVAITSPTQWASGSMCPSCAKATGVKSDEDFTVDQEEYDWMNGNRSVP